MTAKQLFEEMHPGRTILEDVVKPLGMSINALAKEIHIPATRSGWRVTWALHDFGSIFSPPMN